jgi:hypothetical protein
MPSSRRASSPGWRARVISGVLQVAGKGRRDRRPHTSCLRSGEEISSRRAAEPMPGGPSSRGGSRRRGSVQAARDDRVGGVLDLIDPEFARQEEVSEMARFAEAKARDTGGRRRRGRRMPRVPSAAFQRSRKSGSSRPRRRHCGSIHANRGSGNGNARSRPDQGGKAEPSGGTMECRPAAAAASAPKRRKEGRPWTRRKGLDAGGGRGDHLRPTGRHPGRGDGAVARQ